MQTSFRRSWSGRRVARPGSALRVGVAGICWVPRGLGDQGKDGGALIGGERNEVAFHLGKCDLDAAEDADAVGGLRGDGEEQVVAKILADEGGDFGGLEHKTKIALLCLERK